MCAFSARSRDASEVVFAACCGVAAYIHHRRSEREKKQSRPVIDPELKEIELHPPQTDLPVALSELDDSVLGTGPPRPE